MIQDDFVKEGNVLFRWRSYVPLLLLPLFLFALPQSEWLEKHWGYSAQTAWEVFCISVSILGLLIRVVTIGWIAEGTSGRNTQGQLAATINTTGMYSVVRHPLYLGNFLMVLGIFLFTQVAWFVLLACILFMVFYERIMFAEEFFLKEKFGKPFEIWANKTPAFIPKFFLWITPRKTFSWKMVLKREYAGVLGLICSFVAVKYLAEIFAEREFEFRLRWAVCVFIGLLIYLSLRTLRKKTDFFKTT